MAALKWTYPRFGFHGSALGFWKLDILHENPEILIFSLWLQACCDLLNIRIWRWSLDTYLNPIMSAFHLNLNQFNRIIESKVMVEIPICVWLGIQIRIRFWIILDFFTFGQLLNIWIWRWSLDTYLYPIMSAFHPNLNQFNRIIESKVMVEIPICVWARI